MPKNSAPPHFVFPGLLTTCALVPPAVLAFGSFEAQQPYASLKPDAPATPVSSGGYEPQGDRSTLKANDALHSCSLIFETGALDIAMVKHKPFTAEESVTMWRALPSDGEERRELEKRLRGWKTSPDGTKLTATLSPRAIARDSAGRVSKITWDVQSSYRQGTLCDPQTGRMASFSIPDSVPPYVGPNIYLGPRNDDYMFEKPSITWLPLRSSIYPSPRWESVYQGWNVSDLGYRDINGIRAHGHRWRFSRGGGFVEGDFKELWTSEELQVDVPYVEQSNSLEKGKRAELTHLHLKEPDGILPQFPKGSPASSVRVPKEPLRDPCAIASPGH